MAFSVQMCSGSYRNKNDAMKKNVGYKITDTDS